MAKSVEQMAIDRARVLRAWEAGHRSVRAIADACDISRSAAHRHLQAIRGETLDRLTESAGLGSYIVDTLAETEVAAGRGLSRLIHADDIDEMRKAAAVLDRAQGRRMAVLAPVWAEALQRLLATRRDDGATALDRLLLGSETADE